jgi:hypothetical protein
MPALVPRATAVTLAGIGGLHLVWATGSPFPFRSRDRLADSVVGRREVPSSGACVAVAGALFAAAALVGGTPRLPANVRRVGVVGVSATLGGRGVLGLLGRTDVVSPGSSSAAFRRLDRRYLAPLCLALAAGSATALRDA